VLDVPLLIETKIYQWVGKIVVVYWFASLEPHETEATDDLSRAALPKYSCSGSCSGINRPAMMQERDYKRSFLSQINSNTLTL
jgi:hypothetical protein